jgi:ribosomal protein L21E
MLLVNFCRTERGPIKMSTFLINYHVGDIVDIKANAAQQKGMPHKYYHGFAKNYLSIC